MLSTFEYNIPLRCLSFAPKHRRNEWGNNRSIHRLIFLSPPSTWLEISTKNLFSCVITIDGSTKMVSGVKKKKKKIGRPCKNWEQLQSKVEFTDLREFSFRYFFSYISRNNTLLKNSWLSTRGKKKKRRKRRKFWRWTEKNAGKTKSLAVVFCYHDLSVEKFSKNSRRGYD